MLSGVKFISRDEINTAINGDSHDSTKDGRKSRNKEERSKRRKKNVSSSDDEQIVKIKKRSKKNNWYSSDDLLDSASHSEGSSSSKEDEKLHKRSRMKKKNKKSRHHESSGDDFVKMPKKKSKRSKKDYSGEDFSSYGYKDEEDDDRRKANYSKGKDKVRRDDEIDMSDGTGVSGSANDVDIVRREMGLDWMLRPAERVKKNAEPTYEQQSQEPPTKEKVNPKELNPYLRDNGSGYPEDADQTKTSGNQLLSSSLVGDGGASWRLKALKRAQEQAARDGRNLEEVVQERWGSLGHLAVSVASCNAAAPRAHLHSIKSRKMGAPEEVKSDANHQCKGDAAKGVRREYLKDVSVRHPEMRPPQVRDSLSWGKRKGQYMHKKDAELVSRAVSSINKFSNDGNFMKHFIKKHDKAEVDSPDASNPKSCEIHGSQSDSTAQKSVEDKQPLSANQLAAKAMQLRLKGKHEEAEKLLKESENAKVEQDKQEGLMKLRNDVTTSRYVAQDITIRQKGKEDDSDIHLAQSIMKNKQYNMSTQADDEYDYDGAPTKKSRRKGAEHDNRTDTRQYLAKRIVTQQERCVYCFENPRRPKHLVVAIANFTYLMLPHYQPVAPGHCFIVTLQHEQGTRMVDDNVWEEIRNFKKCLIMMFAKQDKEMIFLETVMGFAQQRRHCMIECIPLPQDIAKEAPLYFKKAIDEAEDEWSQHNAKKLIDTSQKGLRSSIPKNFPYFHVEFGLNRGFVHVIDDETQFKSSLGLNVIRGMLQNQDEDMYRRRRYESIEGQRQAVAAFAKDWEPFDWTKQLD